MATVDLLKEAFDDFGFEVPESIIDRCVDLCITYLLDPNEFADLFMAFSATHMNGAEPTDSTLDDFERKDLASYKSRTSNSTARLQRSINEFSEIGSDEEVDDVMGSYICTTPKAQKPARSCGISTAVSKNRNIPGLIDSPISVVPAKDATEKVVYTFGISSLMKTIDWMNTTKQTVKFERISEPFSSDQHYMYDNLLQKTSIAADRIFDIGEEICAKLIKEQGDVYEKDLYDHVFKLNALTQQDTIKSVGRICSDSDDRLGVHSTLLISADEMCLRPYHLHFDRMKSFALFPGQTVFLQGHNPRGDSFFVEEIIAERNLTYTDPPKVKENLYIVVASGPFTSKTDLGYEPLNELLAYCKQNSPDVLVLLGPFFDADHPSLLDGSMKSSVEAYFDNMITGIVNTIGVDTEVFVVSSSQDVHSTFVYPTAPYVQSGQSVPHKNVTFLPDPCIIKLNGVTIGMTATDIYSHISDAEIAVNVGDKVKRVANYLFHQASFYPLNPPSEKVSVDNGLAQQFAALPIVPNILILKSDAKCFAREVKDGTNGCLVLNPGSMWDTQNSTNGTFSRLIVTPTTDDTASLNSIIACQIMKV